MSQKANILNCHVDKLTMNETIKLIDESIQSKSKLQHVVVNAAKLVNMQSDLELHNSVVSCDIINADGQAVVWASKILGDPLPERVAGIDIMENLVELAHQKNYNIFFLGAKEDIVKEVVNKYSKRYSPDIIAGYRNGYFDKAEEREVARQISSSGADILFVAITSPKKENFLRQNSDLLVNVSFTMGVGGSFDVVSGYTKRAPVWMQKVGMEWFYRFAQEPKRMWKRYLRTNSLFVWYVFKAKLGF